MTISPLLVVAVLVLASGSTAAYADNSLFGATAQPSTMADVDPEPVELGVRFSADADGAITGLKFFKSTSNAGPHTGTLWTDAGQRLATVRFASETTTGWQSATFSTPVAVSKGTIYRASYYAPSGRYSASPNGFDKAVTNNHLTVPQNGGVYRYGAGGGFPTSTSSSSNYFVDVVFRVTGPAGSQTTPATSSALALPRTAWEGANYWSRFAKTKAAGWSDPSFFPIATWWSVASSAQEVAFDKSMGLNTYVLTNPSADYRLMENGGMFWVGGQLPGATATSKNWVGSFLDDEVDGRYTPRQGFKLLQKLSLASDPATTGRFRYANFTSGLVTYDQKDAVTNQYVNRYTDAVSVDQYFYGVPQCDWGADALRWRTPVGQNPITPANCRTSSSYGKIVHLMREADATDGKLQSIWNFLLVVGDDYKLDFDKVQGQAMNSVIHGARGIIWFPQSFTGGCETGNAFRTYETSQTACLKDQVLGAQKVNLFIKSLAPVINTQSYVWNFGTGIDSMLKVKSGSAYVFAMTTDGGSGSRTFTLPPGVNGSTVEVVGEGRTLEVNGGSFTDSFAKESSYHVYKISLS